MEIAQDFKDAWTWFILHKIGENIKENPDVYEDYDGSAADAIRLLGLNDVSVFRKAIGFMPKLEGAHVKVRSDLKFFEAELGGDFKYNGELGQTTLNALSDRVVKKLSRVDFRSSMFIYFDELETFYHTPEQHRRDQRMVRDLLFSVAALNDKFRKTGRPIHILAAVRSEVIDAMGSLGQEVDRLVHDRGYLISWHHANRSMHHPLMRIIEGKLKASERAADVPDTPNILQMYFPHNINGDSVDQFMLDKSFYKPRDIVWRLSIAQKLFPNETRFTDLVLRETETEYSGKLWDEVRYEMSALYSDQEIDAIEGIISGGSASFEIIDMEKRFSKAADRSNTTLSLMQRRSAREILGDLYRLGAVGNSFRAGSTGTDVRNRWAFRGDPTLLVDKRMVIHPALLKRLSVVSTRRRGSRPGR